MEKIILNRIINENNTIKYDFSVSDGLSKYFSGKPFVIEYQEDITSVPDSVAAVPFVCNVLPIIWLTDSELVLDELDKAFFECIPEVRKGYETMFPESTFAGKIIVKRIVNSDVAQTDKCALMFSGGLDAVSSLVTHLDEQPELIAVWGADIEYDNKEGWDFVQKGLDESARQFNLNLITIKSSFRKFDDEKVLSIDFQKKLKDGWWHGVKHGIGLLGHVAPLAYVKKYNVVYIASSFCAEDKDVRCASYPTIDNNVKFVSAKIIHDGFGLSRQDKMHDIVLFGKQRKKIVPLRVCWQSLEGVNCCKCEKCYRTILELILEGADPLFYGFREFDKTCFDLKKISIEKRFFYDPITIGFWIKIKEHMIFNIKSVKKSKYWKHIRWIVKADFSHPETIKPSLRFRMGEKMSAFGFYRFLHHIKVKLKNKVVFKTETTVKNALPEIIVQKYDSLKHK